MEFVTAKFSRLPLHRNDAPSVPPITHGRAMRPMMWMIRSPFSWSGRALPMKRPIRDSERGRPACCGLLRSSPPGIAVRRTASLRSPMTRWSMVKCGESEQADPSHGLPDQSPAMTKREISLVPANAIAPKSSSIASPPHGLPGRRPAMTREKYRSSRRMADYAALIRPCNSKCDYRRRVPRGMLCRGRPSAAERLAIGSNPP